MGFHGYWIAVWTTTVLPAAVASLRGWSPPWARAETSRRRTARGHALLLTYGAALSPSLLALGGVPWDGWIPLRIATGPLLLVAALVLEGRAWLVDATERRTRRVPAGG
jgi:hypothetical protein